MDIYHTYSGRPGYRMMRIFLERRNITLSAVTVHKYMKELGLKSVVVPKKPRYEKGECYKKFANLLEQDFEAEEPNQKWCTDFTYLYLKEGEKRYNCSVIDLYDKSVVATKNSSRIDAKLAVDTLKLALERNVINGIIQSMSRAGCPYDNAPMESFYGTLKAELIRQNKFTDDELLNEAVTEYSYVRYKGERKSGFLGALH